MKSFYTRTTSLMVLGLAFSAIGCGAGADTDAVEASINDRALAVRTSDAAFFPAENMTPTVFLSSWEGSPCSPGAGEAAIRVQIAVGSPEAVPLDTPIAIGREKSPVSVSAAAESEGCDIEATRAGEVTGTVTFTELDGWRAAGSVDLQIEVPENACAVASPMRIEYAWDRFSTSRDTYECFD